MIEKDGLLNLADGEPDSSFDLHPDNETEKLFKSLGPRKRKCPRCGERKTYDQFHKARGKRGGIDDRCKECELKRDEHGISRRQKDAYMREYGITSEDYKALFVFQQGACGICGSTMPSHDPRSTLFAVDHDHADGAVRGLLCADCNTGLGLYQDSIARLERAIWWIRNKGMAGGVISQRKPQGRKRRRK